MRRGIDVSENNGYIDWQAVKEEGVEFAIVRLGYGNRHLDEQFYDNVNGALDAGLDIGVYYYSYALDADAAEQEAHFLVDILEDCGLTMEKLKMGVWFDMEDADGYKRCHYVTDRQTLTDMCVAFASVCEGTIAASTQALTGWKTSSTRRLSTAFPFGAPSGTRNATGTARCCGSTRTNG